MASTLSKILTKIERTITLYMLNMLLQEDQCHELELKYKVKTQLFMREHATNVLGYCSSRKD